MKPITSNPHERARIDRDASQWVQRMQDGAVTEDDWRAFSQWRDADPKHGEAFDVLMEVWDGAPQLVELASLADPSPVKPWWQRMPDNVGAVLLRPRWVLGSLVGAAAAAGALAVAILPHETLDLFNPPNAEYATQVGQLRQVTLSDGTVVTLGARSEVAEHFSETERRVTLVAGEAFFEVSRNPTRPFFVEAGAATVRVIGTKFDVNRRDGLVGVSVLEGEVHVSNEREVEGDQVRVLHAGEQVSVAGRAQFLAPLPVVQPVSQVLAAPAGDWRNGRLTFYDMRLADVAADINRYYGPGLRVDPSAADLRITAAFRVSEIETFLNGLDVTLPLDVTRSEDGSYVARATAGSRP